MRSGGAPSSGAENGLAQPDAVWQNASGGAMRLAALPYPAR